MNEPILMQLGASGQCSKVMHDQLWGFAGQGYSRHPRPLKFSKNFQDIFGSGALGQETFCYIVEMIWFQMQEFFINIFNIAKLLQLFSGNDRHV